MKTCPQCNTVYDEDYVFCLADGNTLLDRDGEQETVPNRKFSMPPVGGELEMSVYCGSCGLENTANSKFCKKCGESFEDDDGEPSPQTRYGGAAVGGQAFGETVTFQSPKFTPPAQPGPTQPQSSNKSFIYVAVGVGAVFLFGIIFVGLMIGTSPSKSLKKSGDNGTGSNSQVKNQESSLPDTFDRDYEGSVNGKRQTMPLTMHLKRDKSIITGWAETSAATDELSGSIEPNGGFQVNGTPAGKPTTGIWKGRIYTDGSITGNWSALDGTKSRPFSVTEKK